MQHDLNSFSTKCCVAVALITTACADSTAPPVRRAAASLSVAAVAHPQVIDGSYIVVLKDDSTRDVSGTRRDTDRLLKLFSGNLQFRYESAVHGFAVDGISAKVAALIAKDPAVAYVEQNAVVPRLATQSNPGNGLDRIDQRALPLDASFSYVFAGAGVNLYIIDTGVDTAATSEFSGRVGLGKSCVSQGGPYQSSDSYGHGTGVASIALGTTYGVAKAATLHSVRISGDAGGNSTFAIEVCGLNWIAGNLTKPAVASMSFTGNSQTVLDAINNITGYNNVSFVKAAGNNAADAYSDDISNRGSYEVVVGASDPTTDQMAYFSDYGSSVTLFAPGVGILMADRNNPGFGKTGDGTSFAAPLTAGVIATYLGYCSSQPPTYYCGANKMYSLVHDNATPGVLSALGPGSPNLLLYSPFYAF